MAGPGQRHPGARRTAPRQQRRVRHRGDLIAVLAHTVREVEAAAQRGREAPAVRTTFQAVALLLRDERPRVRAADLSPGRRAGQLKRLDGVATILATTAVRDASVRQKNIDARIAELIDSGAGLAAWGPDGSDEELDSSFDVQLDALVALLTGALRESP